MSNKRTIVVKTARKWVTSGEKQKAARKTMNGQNHVQFGNEISIEKWRENKDFLFIYIYLISCFGLLKQLAWLWTIIKTILILIVSTPVVFSKPISSVGSVLIYSKQVSKEIIHDIA